MKLDGLSLMAILIMIFTALKLTGLVDWSWWVVFSPLWAPITIVMFILFIVVFTSYVINLISYKKKK
jgi:F0F1-type ATP synthase membrane subunit a